MASAGSAVDGGRKMRHEAPDLAVRIGRLARLGRQRDFSIARFDKALDAIAHNGDRADVLRQLLTDWTGLPFEAEDAAQRWADIERVLPNLRERLGSPLGLQTVLLHLLHSQEGLLKEPRLMSESDLDVLRVNAITDPLTGLYNRRFLTEHLSREISRAERSEGIVSTVMMDLKGFKAINDRLGHPVGDSVLVRTARVIRESLRAIDAGGRWGGDEFVLVLPGTDMISALAVAERVRSRIAAIPLSSSRGGRSPDMDLHYGVASYPHDGKSPDFLLKIADLRLYQCRSQSTFAAAAHRMHPRFAPDDMCLRMELSGETRTLTAPVLDVSFGGIAFRSRKRERWPKRWKAEVVQKHDPERHAIRLRPLHYAPLPGGGVRVGCTYV
jgi:diguanylate cyclase (GGDEF)-like protein